MTIRSTDRLIIGLDVPTIGQADKIVSQIGDSGNFYKIGHQLIFAGGLEFARDLVADGKQVFLDMKLLDIDNTIAKGVENIVKMGVNMLTIHAYPGAMRAAVQAAKGSDLCLLGVSVLTSMDDNDLVEAGYSTGAADLVAKRARQAKHAGMGGVVASALEAGHVRSIVGENMAVVTPGIRPAGSDRGDQKRVMTPHDAIIAGATHLVVARPIVMAPDPKLAATQIMGEIELAEKGE